MLAWVSSRALTCRRTSEPRCCLRFPSPTRKFVVTWHWFSERTKPSAEPPWPSSTPQSRFRQPNLQSSQSVERGSFALSFEHGREPVHCLTEPAHPVCRTTPP